MGLIIGGGWSLLIFRLSGKGGFHGDSTVAERGAVCYAEGSSWEWCGCDMLVSEIPSHLVILDVHPHDKVGTRIMNHLTENRMRQLLSS